MNNYNIYRDIAERTDGDIYIGVVGPVRTGKSTFITKVMENLVLPNMIDKNSVERARDEMPQSGDGRSIMTTQPKFVPSEAVGVNFDDVTCNIRLIDCVGYMVEGAVGHLENDKPRMVVTPWSDEEIPFDVAAEIGTNKVINTHSTISIMVTTDGSITDLGRDEYVQAEEKVLAELKKSNKTYIILLNSTHPNSPETINLAKTLSAKYLSKVVPVNIATLSEAGINDIFTEILGEFALTKVAVKVPQWMRILDFGNEILQGLIETVKKIVEGVSKISDVPNEILINSDSVNFESNVEKSIDLGKGQLTLSVSAKPDLYYRVLSNECCCDIKNEYHLISYIKQLSIAKVQYDKFKEAIEQVKETGYGVVHPNMEDLTLEEPKMYKSGGKFGVKLRASAPSLHIMQVDIQTEVNSMVGNEQQSEELVKYLMEEFENNPKDIWETKMFGKSLQTLVNEGLQNKLLVMPQEVQKKMRKTLGRIVNEGKGGVICILL
ncbi:MAG: stage IV sporulation protein A [Clostridiales bacterium]|nr:stage IV sporulation protein A [Clostridiales bacterium]